MIRALLFFAVAFTLLGLLRIGLAHASAADLGCLPSPDDPDICIVTPEENTLIIFTG